jgi:hypothetical protein
VIKVSNKQPKDTKNMDKRTSKPNVIHEDEMRKHRSKGVIRDTDGTV